MQLESANPAHTIPSLVLSLVTNKSSLGIEIADCMICVRSDFSATSKSGDKQLNLFFHESLPYTIGLIENLGLLKIGKTY